jgi:hypothetical protein
VKEMSYMFSGARTFSQPVADWNVSSVTTCTMEGMF